MRKKNEEFANKQELTDFEKYEDFNQYLKLVELGKCPKGFYVDASGVTRDGRYINAELKDRNQVLMPDLLTISGVTKDGKTYTANTVYSEQHKIGDMLLDWVCLGREPLYVNFLNDDVIVLFNICKLKIRPNIVKKRIWSELYQGFEIAEREELDTRDAWIYKKINNEWKMIRKPE